MMEINFCITLEGLHCNETLMLGGVYKGETASDVAELLAQLSAQPCGLHALPDQGPRLVILIGSIFPSSTISDRDTECYVIARTYWIIF
jgi:hypothetical protein